MRSFSTKIARRNWILWTTSCCLLWSSFVGAAQPKDAIVELVYVPQQVIGGVSAELTGTIVDTPVDVTLKDVRDIKDPTFIGVRTTDENAKISLYASAPIESFVENIFVNDAREWGATVSVDAEWKLDVELLKVQISETNQVVGAVYQAETQARLTLRAPSGNAVWSAVAAGNATRYGRKFSNRNINEVLSDSLRETFASALDEPSLHSVWGDASAVTVHDGGQQKTGGRNSLSPAELLAQLEKLRGEGFETSTLTLFIDQTRLTRSFEVDDLGAWKAAGIDEVLLRRALELPVRQN